MTYELDFDEFFAATFKRVVSQVFAMTGNLAEAEDSVQEAYARAWQRWDTLRVYGDPESWARAVAYRISVSAWRKAANRLSAHRRYAQAEHVPALSPDHLALVAALREIPPDQRRAIVLYHLVGRTIEEIAAETGAPPGTVKTRLAAGRKALAPLLSETDEPTDGDDPPAIQGRQRSRPPTQKQQPSPPQQSTQQAAQPWKGTANHV